jgi:tRNA modification GTPase
MISLGGNRDSQTICAVSTPPGYGGISVIRLSGDRAAEVLHKCVPKFPLQPESHKAYYGQFLDSVSKQEIDQVVALFFEKGRSFTGEETIEISCHGSPIICERILKTLIELGLKAALPGEFTYRAFMNNRLDLIQAESVLSLIESRSQKSAEVALRQLEGDLSTEIGVIENTLTWCLAHIEAGIDFATEDLQVTTQNELTEKLTLCLNQLTSLLSTYQKGKKLKDGLQVALVGQPNVGKSSLLNLLLGFERAIVTAQPGTTRDMVEADIVYDGIRIVFQDTAGLREDFETQDQVEVMGMKRSQEAAKKADLVLFCFDASAGWNKTDEQWLLNLAPQNLVFLANKSDLSALSFTEKSALMKNLQRLGNQTSSSVLFVSALVKTDRQVVLEAVKSAVSLDFQGEQVLLSHARHFENILKAKVFTEQAIEALRNDVGPEFISVELKEALIALQETLGKRFDDQIMDRVFKEFCIGK